MKRFKILGLLFLFSCFSARLATPLQSDVDRVADKFPAYTLSQLNQGKALYEGNCGKCHPLKNPGKYSEQHLKAVVPKMVEKVNNKGKVLDEEKASLILKYVITMSRR